MRNVILGAAALAAVAGFTAPALAAVGIGEDGNGNSTPYNHVDMDTNTQGVGYNDVFGTFSEGSGSYGVTFHSSELIDTKNGKAFIDANDGNLGSLSFFLTDPTLYFTGFDLDLFKFSSGISSVTVTASYGNNHTFSKVFDLTSAGNKFGIEGSADSGDYFTKIAFSFAGSGTNVGVEQIKAINIGGVGTIPTNPPAVPEPATWAMMIAGFGLVGGSLRLRRNEKKATLA